MSTTSWLSYLNTVQPEQKQQQQQQFLSDDLRAQLEAWTTVAFDEASFTSDVDSPGLHTDSSKPDPSPYAKRPFGQFQSEQTQPQPSLERGFNAFSTTPSATTAASAFDPDLFTNFGQIGVGVDGSNTLFPEPAGQTQQSLFNIDHVLLGQPAAPTPAPPTTNTSARPSKKQRTGSLITSAASTPAGDLSADQSASPAVATANTPSAASTSNVNGKAAAAKQVLLTKAAILAAQAAELAAKKGETPEEEAARLAELNRIAAEDDKRRRNTAASARFRVKKKQRESALEDTVRELNGKLEKLEKELEATKVENNFLRDLVVRKVGLADLPVASPGGATGPKSGGQEGPTGMGTHSV